MGAPRFVPASEALGAPDGVVVYGAGAVGRSVVRVLLQKGIAVRAVLDRRAASLAPVDGLAVGLPETPPPSALAGLPVILGVFNREVDVLGLAGELEASGWGPFVSFVELHTRHRNELGDRYWLGDLGLLTRERESIEKARALYADEGSVALYDALLAFRGDGDYARLPPAEPDSIYVPSDVPSWLSRRPLRLVDGGAYDGDSLETFRRAGAEPEWAACFEPDPETFARLSRRVAARGGEGRRVLFPCALTGSTGRIRFSAGSGESSRVDPAGRTDVSAVALDDVLFGFAPTLVKLDIEGAELDALEGMARTIERHRPDLAISVYHLPDHLWRIPAWVASRGLGHRLYLRSHAWSGFETVLYAVACPPASDLVPAPRRCGNEP